MKKISYILLLLTSSIFARDKICNYNDTDYIDYLGHTYNYLPGNINETCIKVFTNTHHMIKEDKVEIPTTSNWKITAEGECRCVDATSPESMFNRTFPKENDTLTTKEILANLKKLQNYTEKEDPILIASVSNGINSVNNSSKLVIEKSLKVEEKESSFKIDKTKQKTKVVVSLDSNLPESISDAVFINTLENEPVNNYTEDEMKRIKSSANNMFVTTRNYMLDLSLNEKGEYSIDLELSKDINVLQVFNENLERIGEFKFNDPYSVKGKFNIKTSIPQRITLVTLNPYGNGKLKGMYNIKVNKIK